MNVCDLIRRDTDVGKLDLGRYRLKFKAFPRDTFLPIMGAGESCNLSAIASEPRLAFSIQNDFFGTRNCIVAKKFNSLAAFLITVHPPPKPGAVIQIAEQPETPLIFG
jgi:hypothetical protein